MYNVSFGIWSIFLALHQKKSHLSRIYVKKPAVYKSEMSTTCMVETLMERSVSCEHHINSSQAALRINNPGTYGEVKIAFDLDIAHLHSKGRVVRRDHSIK